MNEELEILLKALKQGYVYYPLNIPKDCYRYRVEGLHYNRFTDKYYIYVTDGVSNLFFEDFGKTWNLKGLDSKDDILFQELFEENFN